VRSKLDHDDHERQYKVAFPREYITQGVKDNRRSEVKALFSLDDCQRYRAVPQ